MYHPTDWILHTTAFFYISRGALAGTKIAQWVHPMKDRSDERSDHGARAGYTKKKTKTKKKKKEEEEAERRRRRSHFVPSNINRHIEQT